MEDLFLKDIGSLLHIGICALLSYIVLFVFIRISGKRTLSKLTAFDFVVTVSLGSILSSMMLGKSPILEGAVALIVVIGLQYVLAYSAKKSTSLEKVLNSKPTLLYYQGSFIEEAMDREVVTREEVFAAVREFRMHNMAEVLAVVMEINGELTVVKKESGAVVGHHSLSDIQLPAGKK